MKRTDQITGAIVIAFGLWVIYLARELPYIAEFSRPGAGFWPFWLGLGTIVLGLLVLVKASRVPASADEPAPIRSFGQLRKPGLVLLAMLVAIVTLRIFGFLVTIGLFLAFLMVVIERIRPVPGLVTAVLGALGFYLVFEVWLKVQLPIGIFGV